MSTDQTRTSPDEFCGICPDQHFSSDISSPLSPEKSAQNEIISLNVLGVDVLEGKRLSQDGSAQQVECGRTDTVNVDSESELPNKSQEAQRAHALHLNDAPISGNEQLTSTSSRLSELPISDDDQKYVTQPSTQNSHELHARRPSKTPRASIAKGKLGYIPDAEEIERAKMESKRIFTIEEILSTEETYYRRLRATWEVYVVPLRQLGALQSTDIDCMFFMWENLIAIHKDFYAALCREKQAGTLGEKIGALFSQYSHVFKMYMPYLANFSKASDLRTQLLLESKHFHEFCGAARKHKQCENLTLMDLMQEPIQRIPRYKLLLQQLLKYTSDDSTLKESIQAALNRISDVTSAIDERIKESNEARRNHETLIDIMMSFTWTTRINLLDDPARYLVKSGLLARQTRKSVKPYYFWLFTDKLIYGEEVLGLEGTYLVHRDISLDACRATVPPPRVECDHRDRALLIESSQKSFIVWTDTPQEAKDWHRVLYETVCSHRQSQQQKASAYSGAGADGIAPMWTPNTASNCCESCETEFSFYSFRHHCRKCGSIVCGACSSFTYPLPNVDKTRESRVCDACLVRCVEDSKEYESLDDYFEKKRIERENTTLGSIKSKVGGLFGLTSRRSSLATSVNSYTSPVRVEQSSSSSDPQQGLSSQSDSPTRFALYSPQSVDGDGDSPVSLSSASNSATSSRPASVNITHLLQTHSQVQEREHVWEQEPEEVERGELGVVLAAHEQASAQLEHGLKLS